MQCILQPTRIIPAVPGSDQLIVTLFTLSVYPSVHNQLIRTIFKGRPVCQLDLNKCTIEKNIMIFDWLVVSGQTTTPGIDRPLIYQWTFCGYLWTALSKIHAQMYTYTLENGKLLWNGLYVCTYADYLYIYYKESNPQM